MSNYGFFAEVFLNLIDILTTFFVIDKKLKDKINNNFFKKMICCLILLVIDTIGGIYDSNIYVITIIIIGTSIVMFIYLYFFKVGDMYYKIYVSVVYIALLTVVSYTAMIILGITITNYIQSHSYNIFLIQVFITITIKSTLIITAIILIYYRKRRKSANKISRSFFSIIIILLIGIVGSVGIKENIFSLTFYTHQSDSIKMLNIPMVIGIFNIFFLVVFSDYEKSVEVEVKLENEIRGYELEKKYSEEVYEIYKEMKAWRHDYRNNIQAIGNLAKYGDIDAIKEYIFNLDIGLSASECIVYTGNNIIDSILTTKILIAKSHEITFDLKIDKINQVNMDNIDISTLLGNLLDNSIEACQRIGENRFIKVTIVNIKKQFIIIVENSTDGKVKYINEKYITSKKSGYHGIGMGQIDRVVNKYKGYINRECSGNIFKTTVVFTEIVIN